MQPPRLVTLCALLPLIALMPCNASRAHHPLQTALLAASRGDAALCLTSLHSTLRDASSEERPSALYWAARCASALHQRPQARAYAFRLLADHPRSLHAELLRAARRARHHPHTLTTTQGPHLLHAIIHTESAFDPHAVSPRDAIGLMQVTVPTARDILPEGRAPRACLFDPRCNVSVGVSYLNRLFRRFNRDLCATLFAYNAGPTRAQRWRRTRPADPVLALDLIPIRETRHYLRRVLTRLWTLQRRHRLPSASLAALAHHAWPTAP